MSGELHCNSCSVRALGIIDFEERCLTRLSRENSDVRLALLSLELMALECKFITDGTGVEYDILPLHKFLKNLPVTLALQMPVINTSLLRKCLYFKKQLTNILETLPMDQYINHLQWTLGQASKVSEVENVATKFLKVCKIFNLETDLTFEDVIQYEFIAKLLKKCFEENVQNSVLITALIKRILDYRLVDSYGRGLVQHPGYSSLFIDYVLEHSRKEKFNLSVYCESHPDTLWNYARYFSVLSSASFGNIERMTSLLEHGFEVFPEKERIKSGHGFPFDEIMPTSYLFILRLLSEMRAVNRQLLNETHVHPIDLHKLTFNQKECFRLLWRTVPYPYVKGAGMSETITAEFFQLMEQGILNPKRLENNSDIAITYKLNFPKMACGDPSPRSLKHLCRCSIRKNMTETWNMRIGIAELDIPKALKQYLNLEED